MKEEDNIQKRLGEENPFRVPDGYFENLTAEVMNRLPEKEKLYLPQAKPSTWQRVRPWLYMAAMFVGAAFIIRIASESRSEKAAPDSLALTEEAESETEYINTVVDKSCPLDDYSLYVYLADAE